MMCSSDVCCAVSMASLLAQMGMLPCMHALGNALSGGVLMFRCVVITVMCNNCLTGSWSTCKHWEGPHVEQALEAE